MARGEINGVGVGIAAFGAVLAWAGLRNVPVVDAFKDLAMGKAPTPRPKAGFADVQLQIPGLAGWAQEYAGGLQILMMAEQVARTPAGRANYCWGGGHTSKPCNARCFDCSGYVSCVLGKLGLMTGSMVTGQFLAWRGAVTIPYEQRAPGDLLVNAGHMGIVRDMSMMWNAACTRCGPVKLSNYTGRRYTVRRVKGGGGGGGGGGSAPRPRQPRVVPA